MSDPLGQFVQLLQPQLAHAKTIRATGPWRVRRDQPGQPFYAVILEGTGQLAVDGHAPIMLGTGDFVLVPAARGFSMGSALPLPAGAADSVPRIDADGVAHLGESDGTPPLRALIGHCVFAAADAALLVTMLPGLLHVPGQQRLATMVQLLSDEARAQLPGRELVLARLLEVVLIEALRSAPTLDAPGLLRALADPRLALALRHLHADLGRAWTVAELARLAALSRSTFFTRFNGALGMAPMAYLLAWRMATARQLLAAQVGQVGQVGKAGQRQGGDLARVAAQVGYGSASAFSLAFTRHVGMAPMRYARTLAEAS